MSSIKQYTYNDLDTSVSPAEIHFTLSGIGYIGVSLDQHDYLKRNQDCYFQLNNPNFPVLNNIIGIGRPCKYQSPELIAGTSFTMINPPESILVEVVEL